MRQNSISYPGERPARRTDIVEQPGYAGKHYFVVNYAGRQLTVHAADETAALFWAAKRWGYSFKRPEYHQSASVAKIGEMSWRSSPELIPSCRMPLTRRAIRDV